MSDLGVRLGSVKVGKCYGGVYVMPESRTMSL